jgi:hypothetical protein
MMKRRTLLGLTVAVLVVVGAATPAGAMTYNVKCAPQTPSGGEYASITEALNAAKAVSPRDHQINVWGNCTETVNIRALDYVRIVGQSGATLSYPSPRPPSEPVLTLTDTRGTEIRNLTILGLAGANVDLVRIFYSTAIKFNTVIIKESGGMGVFVCQRNAAGGVRVSAGSVAVLGENANPTPEMATVVQDNGGTGISIDQNSDVMLGGNVSVLNNTGNGVTATASSIRTCCEIGGLREISGNGGDGIAVNGGHLVAQGPLVIEQNGGGGIYLNGATSQINGGGAPITIRKNGWVGVAAYSNSSVDIYNALIEDNKSAGVQVVDSSTAMTVNSTIKSNGREGVATYYLSVAIISSGNTISNNVGFDLFCTPDSAGRGTKDGVGKLFCSGFNKFPYPEPGPIR